MIPIPEIDYTWILGVAIAMAFFAKAAELEGRSRILGAALSFAAWLVVTSCLVGGIAGGVLSQVLLGVGWAAYPMVRERLGRERRA